MRRMGRAQWGQGWPVRRKTWRWSWWPPGVPRLVSKVLNEVPWLAMPDSKRLHDAFGKRLEFVRSRCGRTGASGMDAGAEEGLVGVDVAHARDGALVQQGGFDGHLAVAEGVAEGAPVEFVAQGFGSEVANDGGQFGVVQCPGPAEASDVDEVEGGGLDPGPATSRVCGWMASAGRRWTRPLIMRCRTSIAVAEAHQQVLAAAVDAFDALADEAELELLDGQAEGEFGIQDCRALDNSSYDVGDQARGGSFQLLATQA